MKKIMICFFVILLPFFDLISFSQVTNFKRDSLFQALRVAKNDTAKVLILVSISKAYCCDDSTLKLQYALDADRLAKSINWHRGGILTNTLLGSYYFNCVKDYKKSIDYHVNSFNTSVVDNDKINQGFSLVYIAKSYEALGRHDQAIAYLNKVLMLNVSRDMNMGALGDMGVIYNGISDYREALICYNKALKVLEQDKEADNRKDTIFITTKAGLILNIGDIYLSMSQADKALENYHDVYRIGEEVHNQFLKFFSTMGLGKAWFFKKNYNEAIKNLELALMDSRTLRQTMYEAEILNQLAGAYIRTNAIDKANASAQASLKIAEANSYSDQLPKTYTTLGRLSTLQQDNKKAIAYLEKALELCTKTKALDDEKNAWEALSVTYDKMNQPAKALDAYRHFINLRDSVYNIDKANELVRIDLQAGFGRKQLADSLKQAGQYELKMQKQQVLTYSVFFGLLLVLLLSFFIYRNYNTQKKYNELLSKEKARNLELIEAQNNVLTDIAYTQSHEIRGPVSTLLGLVQIFNYDEPGDPANLEIIEGITSVTERLDKIVTEVVNKENKVHNEVVGNKKQV